MITLSNPRLDAIIPDYPLGGNIRGKMHFWIEKNAKGARFCRQSTGKVKTGTYGSDARIVDGSDGKTYFLVKSKFTTGISAHSADLMSANLFIVREHPECVIFLGTEGYEEIAALFNS